MALETQSLSILHEALECLEEGFNDLPDSDIDLDTPRLRTIMLEVAEKMRDNYPYHHPLYAGQMLKLFFSNAIGLFLLDVAIIVPVGFKETKGHTTCCGSLIARKPKID